MTATVAAPTGNQYGVLLAIFLTITFTTCVVLWVHEHRWDRHDDKIAAHAKQLATLYGRVQALADFLDVDINDPIDDSPEALAGGDEEVETPRAEGRVFPCTVTDELALPGGMTSLQPDDAATDEFPALPATVPDGMPLAVQTALIEARDLSDEKPHPVDSPERKAKTAADIEERLKRFTFTGGRK